MSNFYDSWRGGGTGLGAYTLQSNAAGNIALVVKAAASQTAKILDVQTSAGTSVFSVDNSGNLVLSGSVTATIDETISGNLALTGNLTVNGNSTLGNASSDTLTVTAKIASGLLFATHNTYDIGSATAAPRDLYVGRESVFSGGGTVSSTPPFRGIATFEVVPNLNGATFVTTNNTVTLSNKTLTAPKIVTTDGIFDAGGDEYLIFTEASTPITYIGVVSGNTTVAPAIRGQGETNTGLLLAGTGTGKVRVGDGADLTKLLTFELVGATTAKTLTLTSSHTDDRTITLPDATVTLASLTGTETLSNKTLTAPKFATGGFIADANGNELIIFTTTASAVNELTIANGATTANPTITASGETNVGINFQAKGTGVYRFLGTVDTVADLRLFEDTSNGTNYVSIVPAASLAADYVLTLPSATDTLVGKATTDVFTNKDCTSTTNSFTAASTTQTGVSELAINTEINTGTDATRSVTPDSLAGSYAGTKVFEVVAFDFTTDMATGDGKAYITIPASAGGMDLVTVHARVITAGTTSTCTIQIANVTQAADMLTTKISIDSAETGSDTAAAAAVIDTANDDVAANDLLRVDVDTIHTTAAKGLIITLEFRLP
jgi:hypothetical protein